MVNVRRWLPWLCLLLVPTLGAVTPVHGQAQLVEPFTQRAPGALTQLRSQGGQWSAEPNHASIQAIRGSQALRIMGGEHRIVELTLDQMTRGSEVMTFEAERWTRRAPFEFRIQRRTGDGWQDIYNGDNVAVGEFPTRARVTLPTNVKQLRFICTSHPEGGVMIRNFSILPPRPMSIQTVQPLNVALPVLINKPRNPVAGVRIDTEGELSPITVRAVRFTLDGTTRLDDIASVEVVTAPVDLNREHYATPRAWGATLASTSTIHRDMTLRGELALTEGVNGIWLCVTTRPNAELTHRVGARITSVTLSNGRTITLDAPTVSTVQRLGVSVRDGGDDGSSVYRIPGLATTNNGTLIAVYDIRWDGWVDLPGNIDVGMSRSTDSGRTWEPMKAIIDFDASVPGSRGNGVGDPAVLVDRQTNTIWVAALWSKGNRAFHGSGPGLTPDETGQLVLVRSDDDGLTWSEPINITAIKDPAWRLLFNGPGKGVTMRDGTLVFAAQFKDEHNMPHSTILYSPDRGSTWHIGTGARSDTTEAQVVELDDGVLMLNMRDNRGGWRAVATTQDMGKTWQEHPTSRKALPEPHTCMASLIRIDELSDSRRTGLLFSNPAVSAPPRRMMTIKYSPDDGQTWPQANQILLDAGVSAGYSCLTMVDNDHVGILYESSRAHLVYQVIPLKEIVSSHE